MNTRQNDILIFRTSVRKRRDIKRIASVLDSHPKVEQWNVDFEDWEKVLRIECEGMAASEISEVLRAVDIWAVELQ